MSTLDPLDELLGEPLDDSLKKSMSISLWGQTDDEIERQHQLQSYFHYYQDQVKTPAASAPHPSVSSTAVALRQIQTHRELVKIILSLRVHHETPRKDLCRLIAQDLDNADANPSFDIDGALDLVVRLMFMVSCRRFRNEFTTRHVYRPIWKGEQSLNAFISNSIRSADARVGDPSDRARTVHLQSLTASNLRKYSKTKIIWTNNILDHLVFRLKDGHRTLRVFRQMGFLEMSSKTLANQTPELSITDSLALGCLPPAFVNETIRTIQLLFPRDDDKSLAFLKQSIEEEALDHRLAGPYYVSHSFEEYGVDASLSCYYFHDLFDSFPYWGDRLYRILKEIEDPTPMTWYEKWSDRKKNPRYTYWAGVIALALALLFGIFATLLGALQVWISYCSWQGDSGGSVCKVETAPTSKAQP